ncbi:Alpha/Beta hydrolase protein [Aspergillus avenaceus]|uniref:Alpha/Beta hydrolase protein n=1 Tax=Aspergillus avenaceus TaxID=36643 RepID=A0A5N6THV9_ASPAV|nr:Alpha/Beta hydrolase protein [Aspergillus avenaceus]
MLTMDHPEDSAASIFGAPFQSSSALLSRRRKSRSHSINRPSVDPSSPELITSLISSLSTISVPLQTHFDNVPRIDSHTNLSLSALPSQQHSAICLDHEPGLGLKNGSPYLPEEVTHSSFLHPDDAAAAPVIRMARAPPSPKPKLMTADNLFYSARPTSKGSYTSSRAAHEDRAFGMITAEPGPRVSTAPSIASTSSRKSLKSQFGLLKKTSREFTGDKNRQEERLRKTSSYNDSLRHNLPRSRTSVRSMHSIADVAEKGWHNCSTKEPLRNNEISTPTDERRSLQSAPNTPGGIGNGKIIPARESSLRHSFSSSSRQRRSARHTRNPSTGSKGTMADNDINNEAEQVTKRIRELKDQQQKIKNELEIDDSPDNHSRELSTSCHPLSQRPNATGESFKESSKGNNDFIEIDESAPAPAVMTGRNRITIRDSPSLASRSVNDSVLYLASRQSIDKSERVDNLRYRHPVEQASSLEHHQRAPSDPISPCRTSIVDEHPSIADPIDIAVLDYVLAHRLTQKVIHPATGREIAFSEVGDPKGHVVLCCLGMGLTRYLMAFYDELARSLHLRLVTLDRPGVGESGPYVDETGTPLGWPDDVAIVCNHLKVTKFSILAHSAGAIYALATALRIPQHIRGRIHLLAPWIPPSQLSSIGSQRAPVPTNAVPYSQRILRALPTSILKVANSSFMSATSASLTASLPKSPRRNRRKAALKDTSSLVFADVNGSRRLESRVHQQGEELQAIQQLKKTPQISYRSSAKDIITTKSVAVASENQQHHYDYDNRLTHKIWELATTNANPAVDLVVCLERRQPIGFRYVDITRNVVIHHGSRDTRVPVDNVRWLGQTMRRCEVRILEGEGHGLMASATVMGNVLTEIAKEWEDWMTVVQGKRRATTGTRSGIAMQA